MKSRSVVALVGVLALFPLTTAVVGCKKKPPAETAQPTPPPQPVEAPKPIVEPPAPPPPPPTKPTAAKPVTASDLNFQKVLRTVYFDLDKYDLRDDARATLAANAEWLKANGKWRLLIEGNCDERATNEYNMALGERRANSAKQYLLSAGIDAGRIRTISYGEERPADPGHDESAWSKNRRDDFVIEE
ncbi:MAG TPA: peptidoglycan-associated lipoprotein Pal [Verrucomicrobiae bacterium]|nr:peptidoglycan-associated lipoprotein Pal [Verrucomicrobiae bacterium]